MAAEPIAASQAAERVTVAPWLVCGPFPRLVSCQRCGGYQDWSPGNRVQADTLIGILRRFRADHERCESPAGPTDGLLGAMLERKAGAVVVCADGPHETREAAAAASFQCRGCREPWVLCEDHMEAWRGRRVLCQTPGCAQKGKAMRLLHVWPEDWADSYAKGSKA